MLPKTTQQRNTNKHAALSIHSLTHEHTKDGTASRDYSDYVITECWRGIERSYDGNMAILPVWKAWSRVHNEVILHKHTHTLDVRKTFRTWLNHKEWGVSDSCDFLPWLHNFAKFKQTLHTQTHKKTQAKWNEATYRRLTRIINLTHTRKHVRTGLHAYTYTFYKGFSGLRKKRIVFVASCFFLFCTVCQVFPILRN